MFQVMCGASPQLGNEGRVRNRDGDLDGVFITAGRYSDAR